MTALERLKMIQTQFKAQWVGISTDSTGKPGTSTMCNPDRFFPVTRQERDEVARADKFMRVFETLRNIEQDHALLLSVVNDRQGRTT